MAKKKKESHEEVIFANGAVLPPLHEEVQHVSDDAVQLSEAWIAEEPKKESDFEKHPKFSKFKEGK
jgi:hypothetical protein